MSAQNETLALYSYSIQGETPKNVVLRESVKYICDKAFFRCTNMETLYLPDGMLQINREAFYDCISLREVSLPASLLLIGRDIFHGCDKMETVRFRGSKEQFEKIRKAQGELVEEYVFDERTGRDVLTVSERLPWNGGKQLKIVFEE